MTDHMQTEKALACLTGLRTLEPICLPFPNKPMLAEAAEQMCRLLIDGLLLEVYQANKTKGGPLRILAPSMKCIDNKSEVAFAHSGSFGRTEIPASGTLVHVSGETRDNRHSKFTKYKWLSAAAFLSGTSICIEGAGVTRRDLIQYLSPTRESNPGAKDLLDGVKASHNFSATNSAGVVAWRMPSVLVELACLCQHVFTSRHVQVLYRVLTAGGKP